MGGEEGRVKEEDVGAAHALYAPPPN